MPQLSPKKLRNAQAICGPLHSVKHSAMPEAAGGPGRELLNPGEIKYSLMYRGGIREYFERGDFQFYNRGGESGNPAVSRSAAIYISFAFLQRFIGKKGSGSAFGKVSPAALPARKAPFFSVMNDAADAEDHSEHTENRYHQYCGRKTDHCWPPSK